MSEGGCLGMKCGNSPRLAGNFEWNQHVPDFRASVLGKNEVTQATETDRVSHLLRTCNSLLTPGYCDEPILVVIPSNVSENLANKRLFEMNFTPFGVPISAALPIATQFQAGKITQNVTTANGQVVGVLEGGENGVHYIRPIDMNSFTTTSQNQNNGQQTQTLITLPITMPGAKPGDPQQTVQIQVINPQPVSPPSPNEGQQKFHMTPIPIQTFGQGATVLTVAYNGNQEGIQIVDGQNGIPEGMTVVAAIQPQDIQLIQTSDNNEKKEMTLIKSESNDKDNNTGGEAGASITAIPYLQNASVQEYLQKMHQNTALPLSLQQFLKFNTPGVKQEQCDDNSMHQVNISTTDADGDHKIVFNHLQYVDNNHQEDNAAEETDKNGKKKKKYKKKPPKPKKPKPGQVHIATALDGTILFCCPECHMAYPEKELLEQHLVGHKIERRFICDICGAGLKRKEHLERHKLGHNPERPFVCSICMKGFKRKEHLNLHFVIHSGVKTEICDECGKGFYRKDHLRKHQRSHMMRRAKELAERQNLLAKDAGNENAQVTIQIPNHQLQIPVQIQVPQHAIQLAAQHDDEENNQIQVPQHAIQLAAQHDDEENNQIPDRQLQIPVQIQVPQHAIQLAAQHDDEENNQVSTVVLPSPGDELTIIQNNN